jgi:hypothetical protein
MFSFVLDNDHVHFLNVKSQFLQLFRVRYFVFNGLCWNKGIMLASDFINNSKGTGNREEIFLMLEKNYLDGKTLIENGELKNMILVMFGIGFILIKGSFDFHFPFML